MLHHTTDPSKRAEDVANDEIGEWDSKEDCREWFARWDAVYQQALLEFAGG